MPKLNWGALVGLTIAMTGLAFVAWKHVDTNAGAGALFLSVVGTLIAANSGKLYGTQTPSSAPAPKPSAQAETDKKDPTP